MNNAFCIGFSRFFRHGTGTRLLAAAAIACAPTIHAKELFEVSVEDDYGTRVSAHGKTLLSLLEDVVEHRQDFGQFRGLNYAGSLSFLGVPDAIKLSSSVGGTGTYSLCVEFPHIGSKSEFTGSNAEAVYSQVEDYFLQEGSTLYGKFLREIARRSLVAITDGNPHASTALAANAIFFQNGFTPPDDIFGFRRIPLPALNPPPPAPAAPGAPGAPAAADAPHVPAQADSAYDPYSGTALIFSGGDIRADGFTGRHAEFSLPWQAHLGEYVDFGMSFNVNYLELEGAMAFGAGVNIFLPIHPLHAGPSQKWNWTLAPVAGVAGRASEEMLSGGALWMAGGFNSVDFRVNNWFALSLVNQATYHRSIKLSLKRGDDNYALDPNVDQIILKNGLRALFRISKGFYFNVFAVETNFLKDAGVPDYTTSGAGLKWNPTSHWSLAADGGYDFADDYRSWTATVRTVWSF